MSPEARCWVWAHGGQKGLEDRPRSALNTSAAFLDSARKVGRSAHGRPQTHLLRSKGIGTKGAWPRVSRLSPGSLGWWGAAPRDPDPGHQPGDVTEGFLCRPARSARLPTGQLCRGHEVGSGASEGAQVPCESHGILQPLSLQCNMAPGMRLSRSVYLILRFYVLKRQLNKELFTRCEMQ